ncbi:MAG: ABC-2 transporter permease [Candidatus Krumholzibacteriota bacterium]|nr:ABC-2 transporter permease [Candidatus Krumholzibacteriota bacterium]
MLALVNKDLSFFLWFALFALAIVGIVWSTDLVDNDVFRAGVTSALSIIVVMMPVLSLEQREEKDEGYRFLRSLPVGNARVVAAKAALPLAVTALWLAVTLSLAGSRIVDPVGLAVARGAIVDVTMAALVVSGCAYVLIFTIGYTRFAVIFGVGLVALGIVNALLLAGARGNAQALVEDLVGVLRGSDPRVVVPGGALFFCALMAAGARAAKYER